MPAKDAMRQRILDAAKKRFKHYGYAKTSMAEIAADLQMSPGNLYRYFPGKIDIALAIADDSYEIRHDHLAEIAHDGSKSTIERLRDLFHADMVETYKTIEDGKKVVVKGVENKAAAIATVKKGLKMYKEKFSK